ncbi:MAG TPA: glycosyltransferase N-terminal domain-containing protein [Thermoanaerobaculia bacterium]|nr:glycosyltransferase N-terminal domain-containing protein [Thermoanaerobaculia bacterium]
MTGAGRSADAPRPAGRVPLLPLLAERIAPRREPSPAAVWIQAVSVGEIEIAVTLVAALRARAPELPLLVTSTTPAGMALLPVRFGREAGVSLRPFPLDLGPSVRRFFDAVRPGVLALVETEIWPRALAEAARRGVPVVVVNGRLSERSLRGLRLLRPFLARALDAVTHVAARTPEDAARFVAAGIPAPRVTVSGDLKFDRPLAPEPAFAERVRTLAAGRPVVVAGSLAEVEIPVLLEAHRSLRAAGVDAFLLVAPRQPAAFDDAFRRLSAGGLAVVRRTDAEAEGERADVFLLDTIGELASAYRAGAAALLGGTFAPRGGHNVLEPLRAGLPVVHGPSVANIAAALGAARGAAFPARSGEEAGHRLADLLRDDGARRRAADAAGELFARHAGATERAAAKILSLRAGAP